MLKIRHVLEYVGLVILLKTVEHMPLACVEDMACLLADCWYLLNRQRRTIARNNILTAGITGNKKEAARIARGSFQHFATLVIESLKADQVIKQDDWNKHVKIDIPETTMKLLEEKGQGILLVSGHLGNWEVAARYLATIKPVMAITRRLNNPYTNSLMQKRKSRERLTLTPKHDANSSRFLSILKEGGILAILSDQAAPKNDTPVEFFGKTTYTYTSPALLHLVTKTPLCFGYCVRTGPLQYRMIALPPIEYKPTGKRRNDVREIMTIINHALEDAIRQYPTQYLWAHRRWR